MNKILVTCYVNPDLDGVASAVAYAEYLQKKNQDVIAGIIGEMHEEVKFILNRFDLLAPKKFNKIDKFEKIILVDSSELNGLAGKISPEKVIEIIDHRKINEAEKFPNAKVQIELVGAAATLVAEKFMKESKEISKQSAMLLYGAIISNTLNFKASVTTDRDKAAADWLNLKLKLPKNFWRELFSAKSDLSGKKLKERLDGDLAWFTLGNKKISIAQIEIMGIKKLINERELEIIKELKRIKKKSKLDYIFLNAIELEYLYNMIVAFEDETKKILEEVLSVKFIGNVAKRQELIMRKQIIPLLKKRLEEN